MARIRALVVDDSTVVRRMLSDIISDSDDFEVAGTAANGKIALAKIPQLMPDVVTLDMEMPEMGGLETIKEIRHSYPTLPIVLFSAFVASEGKETRNAISCGANDFVTKPTKAGSPEHAKLLVRFELLPKLRKLYRQVRNTSGADRSASPVASGLPPAIAIPSVRPVEPIIPRKNAISPIELIAIGVSTGGP
ncbi:MAG: response regulator, partial [Planctomycetes bacterium]|nr:response regulator [Planctomycetota bacterium]